ncbi:MAG: glyceraldehyde 3-phosphate dehydrogenase NAD-binding domain-containing protein, partial [Bacteroidota bacterium]|nr:glyceraldehyde 3-phosphate dehydrogenase NAD-binding domain-containing protein [Bacteroidota bacterium]
METLKGKKLLGINGLGRIGKLSLWYHLQSRYFDGIVINVGREVGKGLEAVVHTIETDSTYGSLDRFLYGMTGKKCEIRIINPADGILSVDGFPVKILRKERNPKDISWSKEGVKVVVDCTGKFLDPTIPSGDPKGSIRGHLDAGALKVIASAPFKIKDTSKTDPVDSPTLIYGINHLSFNPREHNVISAASCTTTGLAHIMKPLLDNEDTSRILTASMSTVHAATNTQSVLDSVPSANTSDLRKNRSVL